MQKNSELKINISNDLVLELEKMAIKQELSKSEIIELSLRLYFEKLKRIEYIKSFKRAANDQEVVEMAEEGMGDYFALLYQYE